MAMIAFVLAIALIASNGFWWLHVRHLSGITSDLRDVGSDVKQAAATVKSASATVQAAAQNIAKG